MKTKIWMCFIAVASLTALTIPASLAAQAAPEGSKHHHYKLIDIGTFPGRSVYNMRVTSNGSVVNEFEQMLNDHGTVVGGADTPFLNPYGCYSAFYQAVECYVQHAFAWQNGNLTDLGTLPGGSASFAYFISDNGLITGGSENGAFDPNSGNPVAHGVLWSNGTITDLGTLGGASSLGAGVNDSGQVAGFTQNAISDPFSILGGTQTRAFLWQSGEMYDLGTLGGPDAFGQYVNNNGQVAGVSYTSYTADPNTGLPPLHPFLWEKGKGMKDVGNFGGTNDFLGPFISGLNNRGEVIGTMALAGDQIDHAFLWDGEKLSDLQTFGGSYSFANGLNDAGEVVGQSTLPGDQVQHAFLWRNGAMTDLGTVHGDPCSIAGSLNSKAQVTGASQSAAGGCNLYTSALLWENGSPGVDLNSLVPPHSPLLLTSAGWINDRGEITARGVPFGCGDGDTCGHAALLIPCDQNHPGLEGCDYSLVDAATEAEPDSAPITQSVPVTNENVRSRMMRRGYPNLSLGIGRQK